MRGHRRGGSWHTVLERTLLVAAAFWIGVQALNPLGGLASGVGAATAAGLALAATSHLALSALCASCVRRGVSRNRVALGLMLGWAGVLGGATLAWTEPEGLSRAAQLMVPANAIQALQVFAVAASTRFRTALWTILATGPVFLLLHVPAGITGETVEQWLVPTSATVALAALVGYLRSGGAYAESLDAWNRAARQQAVAASAHDAALAEARRVIHDDVISALRGIAHDAPRQEVVHASQSALEALAEHRESGTRVELLRNLAEVAGVQVTVRDEGWPAEPPTRVLEALRGAAGEALRNVARHSGSHRATVTARAEGDDLVLEVADSGAGLAGDQSGFGIDHSVIGRMRQIGGDATLTGTPGEGTTVTLTWAPPLSAPPEQVTPYSAADRWRGYLPVALAITANSTFLAIRHPGPTPGAALTLAAVMVALVPLSAWWFATHPSRTRHVLPVSVAAVGLTLIGLWLAGDGALLDFRSWIVGFASAIPMLFAFDARLRDAAVPVAAQMAACVAWAVQDPTIGAFEPFAAITTPLVVCGFSALFGALLRRGAHAIRQSEATRAARLEEQAWLAVQEQARLVHLATLRNDVAPFLRDVVAGAAVDPERAALLAARCRDELHLPRPLSEEVRRAVDRARAGGVTVNFRAGEEDFSWPALLEDALEAVLSTSGAEIVTVLPGTDPRLVVLPALTARGRRLLSRRLGDAAAIRSDDIRTVVVVSPEGATSVTDPEPVAMGA